MAQIKAMVDKLLTNVSNGYFPEGHISEQVLPTLTVKEKSGILGGYGNGHLRIVDDLVGGRAAAKRVEPIVRKVDNTYAISSHALEGVVTEDDYDNVEEPFQAESDETNGVTSLIITNKEHALASSIMSTSVISQNVTLSGTSKLSDYNNSDPVKLFKDAQNAVLDGCGKMPNAAVMSQKLFNTLIYHPAILAQLGFSMNRAGQLSDVELAKAMNIKKLYVGDAAYNAAKEGQSDSLQQIWEDSLLFYVRPDAPAKYQVSFGYYLKMASRKARGVYKYALNNPVNSTGIIVKDDYSFQITNEKAAFLIKSAL